MEEEVAEYVLEIGDGTIDDAGHYVSGYHNGVLTDYLLNNWAYGSLSPTTFKGGIINALGYFNVAEGTFAYLNITKNVGDKVIFVAPKYTYTLTLDSTNPGPPFEYKQYTRNSPAWWNSHTYTITLK